MSTLVVDRRDARIGAESGAIVVRRGKRVAASEAVERLELVFVVGDAELSAAARRLLLRADVPVAFLSPGGRYLGRLSSTTNRWAERRVQQMQRLTDPQLALGVARHVLSEKLDAQRQYLLRLGRDHPERRSSDAISVLRAARRRLSRVASIDAARGLEGYAARAYYTGLGAGIRHPDFAFRTRSRRPPLDPVNACLSFGYTLLLAEVVAAIEAIGLDPYVGALHGHRRGAPALALDVMEPLRTTVVDRFVVDLVHNRRLRPADFEHPDIRPADVTAPGAPEPGDARAVYLAESGRRVFFAQWAARWRKDGLRDVVRANVRDIASAWQRDAAPDS